MKTLYIIRHAKSSWNFNLDDQDRPLNHRGRSDVRTIGRHLSENVSPPELILTSTASRALYTALFIADEWGYPESQVVPLPELYHADVPDIREVLSDQKADTIALFGHNPGLTDLVNHLSEQYLDNLPTCAVYAVQMNIKSWSDMSKKTSKKLFFITPKKLR